MSLSNAAETAILNLIFNATLWANVAQNASSSPLTNLYISLHSSDPGEAGDQTTNEISYVGYARVAVVRTSSGWTVSGSSVSPAAAISFPAGTVTAAAFAPFWGIGTAASGAGVLLISGGVTPSVAYGNGITPQLTTGTAFTLD